MKFTPLIAASFLISGTVVLFVASVLLCIKNTSVITMLLFFDSSFVAWMFLVLFVVVFGISVLVIKIFIYLKLKKIYADILRFKKEQNITGMQGNTVMRGNGKKQNNADGWSSVFQNNIAECIEQEIGHWSEERKMENERLNKLEVYRKEFLGNVSHELKTPIFNIQGYVQTLLEGGLEDASINRNYLQKADSSIDRMIRIIDDLEAITQLESKELLLEPEVFDIIALIKEVFENQEFIAKKKKIYLHLWNDAEKPVYVFADRFRVRQALTNLIVNSIKYGKENGETMVKVNDTGEYILTEVTDNGIGIAEKHLSRIFERFYRIDKSRSREQGGTGLGLAIVKHLIEAHHQTVSVMSTEGVGTVFSFKLPKTVSQVKL